MTHDRSPSPSLLSPRRILINPSSRRERSYPPISRANQDLIKALGTQRTAAPVERSRDSPQATIVLVPFAVQVAPDDHHAHRPGPRLLERRRRALGIGARRPGV